MARFQPSAPGDHGPVHGTHGVSLRPIAESDLPALLRWRQDPEVVRFWDAAPEDLEACREEFLDVDTVPVWRFIVEWEGRGVGNIEYSHPYADTDYLWTAGIDIFIGEPDARDRGVGTEAVRTLLQYLFEVKQLHRVTIDPEAGNRRAIRSYEKAGFRFDGLLRHNDRFEDGRYADTYFMSIIEDEWPAARARWEAEVASRR
ncbi:MAG: GNAT family N-acetyltransferase [Dehalococcoidia bacterium]